MMAVGGTDPSGGAGLSADIRTASALGVHCCPVVTAVTVQDSGGVRDFEPVDPGALSAQMEAVLADGPVLAVKSGMLATARNAAALADMLDDMEGVPYVLDPVLASGGGVPLAGCEMAEELVRLLLPRCSLCTPNISEAAAMAGIDVGNEADMEEAASRLLEAGAGSVLLTGGHLEGDPADLLASPDRSRWLRHRRVGGGEVHGTGCTLASACASLVALGMPVEEAAEAGVSYTLTAISAAGRRLGGRIPGHLPGAAPTPGRLDGEGFYLPPRFCQRCGSALSMRTGDTHLFCPACGLARWRNPLPAASLLAVREGRLLLVRRAVAPCLGRLSLPGGFMELTETAEECAARELLEETGLRAGRLELVAVERDDTAYGSVVLLAYAASALEGEQAAGDDASEVLWVPLAEVPPLAFRAHDRLVRRIREASGLTEETEPS